MTRMFFFYFSGAQCNEQIVENIRWTRTPAKNTISVQCPKDVLSKDIDVNSTGITYTLILLFFVVFLI
jgi:hypothetical protein